jgi:hypothetical protein
MCILPLLFATVILVSGVQASAQVESLTSQEGIWSKEAKPLRYSETQILEFSAPDKKIVAVVDGVQLFVVREGQKLAGVRDEGVASYLAELGWAPDSRAFFITWSDGGLVGTWRTSVYLIEAKRVRHVDVTQGIRREAKKNYRDVQTEALNIAAVKWLKTSQNLLLVGEVPPSSYYSEMGKVIGYSILVPSGKIVEQFDQNTLRATWAYALGPRLR